VNEELEGSSLVVGKNMVLQTSKRQLKLDQVIHQENDISLEILLYLLNVS
jgi:hypothetical protein